MFGRVLKFVKRQCLSQTVHIEGFTSVWNFRGPKDAGECILGVLSIKSWIPFMLNDNFNPSNQQTTHTNTWNEVCRSSDQTDTLTNGLSKGSLKLVVGYSQNLFSLKHLFSQNG